MNPQHDELIQLTQALLHAITHSDWATYTRLCAEDLTAFEPEACGHLVEGMPFHKHYFDMANNSPYTGVTTSISSPHVRIMGDAAVVAYVRMTQRIDASGSSTTSTTPETRIWQRDESGWKHVHFHRS